MLFLQKLKGQCQERAPRPNPKLLGFAFMGALLAGSVLGFLAFSTGHAVIMGSFGASVFFVMAAPDVPFSQPRHIIGGHFVASAIGLFFSFDWRYVVEHGACFGVGNSCDVGLADTPSSG